MELVESEINRCGGGGGCRCMWVWVWVGGGGWPGELGAWCVCVCMGGGDEGVGVRNRLPLRHLLCVGALHPALACARRLEGQLETRGVGMVFSKGTLAVSWRGVAARVAALAVLRFLAVWLLLLC